MSSRTFDGIRQVPRPPLEAGCARLHFERRAQRVNKTNAPDNFVLGHPIGLIVIEWISRNSWGRSDHQASIRVSLRPGAPWFIPVPLITDH